jgi:hypothetical protein
VQGDLEPCLTGTRRVLPIHFDHSALDRPRVETRAPEMCAQGFGELGFLERDQQAVRSVLVVRRRGGAEPRRIGLGKLTIAAVARFTRPLFSGSSSPFTSLGRGRQGFRPKTYPVRREGAWGPQPPSLPRIESAARSRSPAADSSICADGCVAWFVFHLRGSGEKRTAPAAGSGPFRESSARVAGAGPEIRSGGSRPNPSRVEQGAIPNPCC